MFAAYGGPNMKWGHIFKWGAGHHWPHAGDELILFYEYRLISLCNLGLFKSLNGSLHVTVEHRYLGR